MYSILPHTRHLCSTQGTHPALQSRSNALNSSLCCVCARGAACCCRYTILTEPENNLCTQQVALMETEGVSLVIEDDAKWRYASCPWSHMPPPQASSSRLEPETHPNARARSSIPRMARLATQINRDVENIGARRLHSTHAEAQTKGDDL